MAQVTALGSSKSPSRVCILGLSSGSKTVFLKPWRRSCCALLATTTVSRYLESTMPKSLSMPGSAIPPP